MSKNANLKTMLEIERLREAKAHLEADVKALRKDLHVKLGCKMVAEMPEGFKIFLHGWLDEAERNYEKDQARIRMVGRDVYYMELFDRQMKAINGAQNAGESKRLKQLDRELEVRDLA